MVYKFPIPFPIACALTVIVSLCPAASEILPKVSSVEFHTLDWVNVVVVVLVCDMYCNPFGRRSVRIAFVVAVLPIFAIVIWYVIVSPKETVI